MLTETPESVRSLIGFAALFTIFAGVMGVIANHGFEHPGAGFALILGCSYAYIAFRWHSLLAKRPGQIRAILIGNLILTGLFTIYCMIRGAAGSAFGGCVMAFGFTSYVLSAVGAYSLKPLESCRSDDSKG